MSLPRDKVGSLDEKVVGSTNRSYVQGDVSSLECRCLGRIALESYEGRKGRCRLRLADLG